MRSKPSMRCGTGRSRILRKLALALRYDWNLPQQIVIPSALAQRIDTAAGRRFIRGRGICDLPARRHAQVSRPGHQGRCMSSSPRPHQRTTPSYWCRQRAGPRRCPYRRGRAADFARATRRRTPTASEHAGHSGATITWRTPSPRIPTAETSSGAWVSLQHRPQCSRGRKPLRKPISQQEPSR